MSSSMMSAHSVKVAAANYLHGVDLSAIDRAWELAVQVHQEQKHFSGEPYLGHVLEVATTLASMRLDLDTILAGILHGTIKEGVSVEELRDAFGKDVAGIVEGSTRISKVQYSSKLVSQAENVRKMLLAIATDIRVLLVKLVDRLQDMFHLEGVSRDVQLEIARETMDLYAPLASRLGIDWLKRELEDSSFRYLHPVEYADLTEKLESSLEERQRYVEEVIAILRRKLTAGGIPSAQIIGRPKHIYSIYKKLIAQNIPLERVYDKVAFRIIVNTVRECYEALGMIHGSWAPVPGRIKDFISTPKANNYQSMHTTVVGPRDHFIEIQIRTEEMDRVAQEGVAAHWAYKEGQKVSERDARLFKNLKKLVRSLQEVEDPREFLDSVRGELYEPDVYALTPGGDVKEFPQGSCPIDFAYAIHSEVGDHCVGAKVNNKLVPLKYQLKNGDIVEIITSTTQTPSRAWLHLVKTGRARSRIRSWLRKEEKEEALRLGREICEREIRRHDTSLKKLVKSGQIKEVLKELRCNSVEDMLVKVATGTIAVAALGKVLEPEEALLDQELGKEAALKPEELASELLQRQTVPVDAGKEGIAIAGIEGMMVKMSRCCNPVPGDAIMGFITHGRGVSVHKAGCPNLLATDPQRRIDVTWSGSESSQYRATLLLSAENKRGVFAEVSSIISADNANIAEISARQTPEDRAELRIVVEVENLDHLQRIMQHLKNIPAVLAVRRA